MPKITQIRNEGWSPNDGFTGNWLGEWSTSFELVLIDYEELSDYYITANSISSTGAFANFRVGDTFKIFQGVNLTSSLSGVITSVSNDIIYYTLIANIGVTIPAKNSGPDPIYNTTFRKDVTLAFGMSLEESYQSQMDGELQGYTARNIVQNGASVSGLPSGSNWRTGTMNITHTGLIDSPIDGTPSTCQTYFISLNNRITYYDALTREKIIDSEKPDDFISDNTLNFFNKITLYTDLDSPQTGTEFKYSRNGNIGWLNERFNSGFKTSSVTNLVYVGTTGLAKNGPTTVRFRLTNALATSPIVLSHISLPEENNFFQVNDSFVNIFDFQEITITNKTQVGSDVDCEVAINLNAIDEKYLLNVIYENVRYVVDVNDYVSAIDIEGLVTSNVLSFKARGCNDRFGTLDLMLDEVCTVSGSFTMNLGADFSRVEIRTLLDNGVTESFIAKKVIGLRNSVLVNGIRQIDTEFIKLNSGTTYDFEVPYRALSQDHIKNNNVPTVFFNPLKLNNGLNLNTFEKQANGYVVKVGLYVLANTTEYLFKSQDLIIVNYETPIN